MCVCAAQVCARELDMVGKSALEVDVIWKSTQQLDLLLVVNCPPESAERRAEPLIHVVECPKKILDYILLSRGAVSLRVFVVS